MNVDAWLVDTIYVAHQEGRDASGDPVFSDPCAVCARVEGDSRLIVGESGNEQQVNNKVATTTKIVSTDRVWLPGKDKTDITEARRVILVTSAKIKNGAFELFEVFL